MLIVRSKHRRERAPVFGELDGHLGLYAQVELLVQTVPAAGAGARIAEDVRLAIEARTGAAVEVLPIALLVAAARADLCSTGIVYCC